MTVLFDEVTKYSKPEIITSLKQAIRILGVDLTGIKNVFIKVNIVRPSKPKKCVVTHPAVVEALISVLREKGIQEIAIGEGPAAGSLRKLGVILAGQDTVAVDAVATKIIGLSPMDIYTTQYADERGLGVGKLQNIEVSGEGIEDVTISDFKPPSSAVDTLSRRMPLFLPRLILRQISIKPNVIERRCTGCAECEKICPVGAITVSSKIAKIDHGICIECMCCHEVCRFDAIVPKQSVTGRTIQFLVNILRKLRATAS